MANGGTTCRVCKSDQMYMCLPLGCQPPANQFLKKEQLTGLEPSFPLDTHVCLNCALIQVPNFIPPDFFRQYVYMPSVSATLQRHFGQFALFLTSHFRSSPKDLVVDIGSNDGLFLKACLDLKSRVLGIEPSANLTEIAREKGVEVVNRYFNPETAAQVREKYGPASIITSTNTFNHIDDLHGFMSGVSTLLDAKGIFVIEVPHSLDLVTKNQFDTVYHEHLSEFSVRSLAYLYEYFDIEIFDIQRLPIHGGSMRVLAQRKQGGHTISPQVAEWRSTEDKAALSSKQTYDDFAKRVRLNKAEMLTLLKGLKAQGKSLAGYGAPAKGNTLLNFYGIGPDLLDFVADRNPLKQGLYSPGMHIPVTPTEEILKRQPDYMLILAWNFAEEVMREQAEYRRRGGTFIIPIPSLQIVH